MTSSSKKPISVLAVDDHAVLREGIAALIRSEPDMELIAQASNGLQAIEMFRLHQPDVTLMDLQMPVLSGIDATIAIRSEFPDARIIVLTTYDGDAQVNRALEAGARGYVLKGHVHRELLDTIRSVHAGRKRIPAVLAVQLAEHLDSEKLTTREVQVLELVAGGNSNKEIAARLSVTEDTIKSHVSGILAKLGANDGTHAVTIGLRRGIIEL